MGARTYTGVCDATDVLGSTMSVKNVRLPARSEAPASITGASFVPSIVMVTNCSVPSSVVTVNVSIREASP